MSVHTCLHLLSSIMLMLPGNKSRGKSATAWLDNISDWAGLRGNELIQATENSE